MTQTAANAETLYEKIMRTFAAGRRVKVETVYRSTLYSPKHAGMFSPAIAGEPGVWVDRGKRREYVLPHIVAFEKD